MGEIVVVVVRVFADANGAHGNALGIVRSSGLTDGREQDIATSLGFSETVFVDAIEAPSPDGRAASIRIFTPARELPFAGHPSVGTAWWLADQGTPVTVLHEKAGDVLVTTDADGAITWVTAHPDWTPDFAWIPLPTPAQVDALDPTSFSEGHHYAYAWADEASGRLRARMFAPDMGIAEDEATGAAAVRVTARLGRDLHISQGVGSELATALVGDKVKVGGRTVFDHVRTVSL